LPSWEAIIPLSRNVLGFVIVSPRLIRSCRFRGTAPNGQPGHNGKSNDATVTAVISRLEIPQRSSQRPPQSEARVQTRIAAFKARVSGLADGERQFGLMSASLIIFSHTPS
jgi:hypothetical protein